MVIAKSFTKSQKGTHHSHFGTFSHIMKTLLYGTPDQSFYANEIARWAQVGAEVA